MQLERLRILHQSMKRFVEMAGVKEFDILLDYEELLDDLELVYFSYYQDVCKVWSQPNMSEEVWAHYEALGIEGLPEQIQLNQALTKLRTTTQGLINRARKLNQNKESSK